MPSIRALEDLIIDAIYLDIVKGKLDQKEQRFEVDSTMGRDVEQSAILALGTALQEWYVVLFYPTRHVSVSLISWIKVQYDSHSIRCIGQ